MAPWARRVSFATILIVGAVAECWLIADLWRSTTHSPPGAVFAPAAQPFNADLTLLRPLFDPSTGSLNGILQVDTVATTASESSIEHVTLAVQDDSEGGASWFHLKGKTLDTFEIIKAPNAPALSAAAGRLNVALAAQTVRNEVWFPIDEYNVTLRADGCINSVAAGRACVGANNLRIARVAVQFADPAFQWESRMGGPSAVIFTLKRRPFERVISTIFLLMVIAFFAFLLFSPVKGSTQEVKDLFGKSLGFLGTLWAIRALLVPKTVTTFPNLVDYVTFGVFFAVFAVVLWRLVAHSATPEPEEKWVD